MYTRYYTLLIVGVGKFHLKSGTGNDPHPHLRDKVPLFSAFLDGSLNCLKNWEFYKDKYGDKSSSKPIIQKALRQDDV